MALYYRVLLLKLLSCLSATSTVAAEEVSSSSSWEGTLNYTAYASNQCQTPIATGTTTKIFKLDIDDSKLPNDISFFCETDIIGNNTGYTKVVFSGCNTENEGFLSFSFISCDDELCSSCEDDWSPEFTGYMTFNTARKLYNNVGSCIDFVGVTVDEEQIATDGSAGAILSDTNTSTAEEAMVPSVFQTFDIGTDLNNLQSYWDVMFDNSCVFSDTEVKSFITNGESEVNWSERSAVDKEEDDSTTNITQEITGDWNGNEKVSSALTFGIGRVVISLALSFVYMVAYH